MLPHPHPITALGKSGVQLRVNEYVGGLRKARVNGSSRQGAGQAPASCAVDSWEHQVRLGTEASPPPSHQQGPPWKGSRGCPRAQPECERRPGPAGGGGAWKQNRDLSVTRPRSSGLPMPSPAPGAGLAHQEAAVTHTGLAFLAFFFSDFTASSWAFRFSASLLACEEEAGRIKL